MAKRLLPHEKSRKLHVEAKFRIIACKDSKANSGRTKRAVVVSIARAFMMAGCTREKHKGLHFDRVANLSNMLQHTLTV